MQTSAKKACFQFAECSLSYAKIHNVADFFGFSPVFPIFAST